MSLFADMDEAAKHAKEGVQVKKAVAEANKVKEEAEAKLKEQEHEKHKKEQGTI